MTVATNSTMPWIGPTTASTMSLRMAMEPLLVLLVQ
jgi:hypothetical protein